MRIIIKTMSTEPFLNLLYPVIHACGEVQFQKHRNNQASNTTINHHKTCLLLRFTTEIYSLISPGTVSELLIIDSYHHAAGLKARCHRYY